MKNLTLFLLAMLFSFSASAQITFNWTSQTINEGNNMKGMNLVNDTTTYLVGYGRTFVRSSDQGLTWDKIPVLDPLFDYGDISINSSGVGYACAGDVNVVDNPASGELDVYADGLLLKTTDFGATWTVMDITKIGPEGDSHLDYPNQEGCYASHFRAVEVLEDNSVFLSAEWYWYNPITGERESYGGTMRSTDGENWIAVADSGYYSLSIEASATNVYYGGLNHLFVADASTGAVKNIYDSLVVAEGGDLTIFINDITIDGDEAYVVTTSNGIYKIGDTGNFDKLDGTGAPTGGNDMIIVNENVWLVLGISTKSKITIDGGNTWTDFYPDATCYEIGGILNDTIYGLGKSGVYKCALADAVAGTKKWVFQEITLNENMQKMHVTDATHAIIAGYGQTLVSTADGGATWNDIAMPELFVYGADYDFEGISTVDTVSYAVSRRMYMIDYPTGSPYADVYGHGLVYKSTDLWKTWELLDYQNIGAGADPAVDPNAEGAFGLDLMTITNVNDTIAFMGARWLDSIGGYDVRLGHANVFRTLDGGDSWLPLFEDQGNNVFNKTLFLDENTGYFLGNSFFRKTEDGGETFTDMYPALQTTGSPDDASLFLLDMVYVDENTWYVLSSVDGLFVTKDGGANYSELIGIGGGAGVALLNDTTIIVLGSTTKSKISWDAGVTWNNCSTGTSIWAIGGILNNELVALAKGDLYKIPLADLEAPSSEADILSFVLAEQNGTATIDANNNTIAIEVTKGTDPGSLTPTITVSEGASIAPASGVAQDFTDPLTYTVTAEDTETKEEWTVTVTIEVGIERKDLNVSLYPNPVSDKLYLNNLEEVDRISIFSITGNAVMSMETTSGSLELDLAAYENGVYFITFLDQEGSVATKKFVINR